MIDITATAIITSFPIRRNGNTPPRFKSHRIHPNIATTSKIDTLKVIKKKVYYKTFGMFILFNKPEQQRNYNSQDDA